MKKLKLLRLDWAGEGEWRTVAGLAEANDGVGLRGAVELALLAERPKRGRAEPVTVSMELPVLGAGAAAWLRCR